MAATSSSPRRRRLWLVGLLGCVALLAPLGINVAQAGRSTARTTAAPTTIATLHSLSEVRAWRGVQAWTDYSTADKRWHVVVRQAGQISIPAAIPASNEPLKVDVGPVPPANPHSRS